MPTPAPSLRTLLARPGVVARLDEELSRAVRYARPLAIIAFDLGADVEDDAALVRAIGGTLRLVDVLGRLGARELLAILPETAENARIPAARATAALRAIAPGTRAGVAVASADATGEAFLARARSAAREAPASEPKVADAAQAEVVIGEEHVVFADPATRRLFALVERLAKSDLPILVTGETGVGKEIVARALHTWSKRGGKKLVSLNCAALPESLLESELFGFERGAFSGAANAKGGLLEAADGGTLFLDEIGECSLAAQAKLLRVLETKRFTRLGAVHERSVDVRIVAATNRDLSGEVELGRFRRDLYFRLSAATIEVPNLASRPQDVSALARAFLRDACDRLGRAHVRLDAGAEQRLARYGWPGNVRELKNVMGYVAATALTDVITATAIEPRLESTRSAPRALTTAFSAEPTTATTSFRSIADEVRELEARRMREALRASGGVRLHAAELIGMPLRTFLTKMRLYRIDVPAARPRRRAGAAE